MNNIRTPNNESSDSRSVITSLLGTQATDWPYSEGALIHALQLKTQQEMTKQQYYKLENINKSIEMLRIAIAANVPGHLIPLLFNNPLPEGSASTNTPPKIEKPTPPSQTASLANSVPLNYKFPPDPCASNNFSSTNSAKTGLRHRRTNSPARIGAAAVAALTENNQLKEEENNEQENCAKSPLEFRGHRRNLSLPLANPTPFHPEPSPEEPKRKLQEPMTQVLNFTPWQSYNPTMVKKPAQQKKHRRTRSASLNPSFSVIDLNVINQVKSPEPRITTIRTNSHTLVDSSGPTGAVRNGELSDDQRTCSDVDRSKSITPPTKVSKGPNFADKLLNS